MINNKKIFLSLLLTLSLCFTLLLCNKSYAFYTISDNEFITFAIKDADDYKNSPYFIMYTDPNAIISSSDDKSFTLETKSTKVLLNIIPLNEDSSFNYKKINITDINFMKEFAKKYNFMFDVSELRTGTYVKKINGEEITCLMSDNENYALSIFVYKDYMYTMKAFYKKEYDSTNEEYNRPLTQNEILSELYYTLFETLNSIELDTMERETAFSLLEYAFEEQDRAADEDIDDDYKEYDDEYINVNKINGIKDLYILAANYLYNNDDIRDAYDEYIIKAKSILGLNNTNEETNIKMINEYTLYFITIIWIVLMTLILFIINKNNRKPRTKTVITMFLLYLILIPLLIEFFNKTGYNSKDSLEHIYVYGSVMTLLLGTAIDFGITYGIFIKLFKKKQTIYDMDNIHETNDSPYVK